MSEEDKLDLGFLNDELPKEEKDKELFTRLNDALCSLEDAMERWDKNVDAMLNKYLATGQCYMKDNILWYKEDGKEDRPIWFPKGNSLEWQLENGKISQEFADTMENFRKKVAEGLRRRAGDNNIERRRGDDDDDASSVGC